MAEWADACDGRLFPLSAWEGTWCLSHVMVNICFAVLFYLVSSLSRILLFVWRFTSCSFLSKHHNPFYAPAISYLPTLFSHRIFFLPPGSAFSEQKLFSIFIFVWFTQKVTHGASCIMVSSSCGRARTASHFQVQG